MDIFPIFLLSETMLLLIFVYRFIILFKVSFCSCWDGGSMYLYFELLFYYKLLLSEVIWEYPYLFNLKEPSSGNRHHVR